MSHVFLNSLNTVVEHLMLWGTNSYHCNWMTNTSSSYCFCQKRVTDRVSEKGEAGRYRPTIYIFLEVFNYQVF